MKRWFIPVLSAVALAWAVFFVVSRNPVRSETTPVSPPPAAAYATTVAAVGLVEPASENIAISTMVPGLVTQVFVKAGRQVRKGQPLFSLDDRDLKAEFDLRRRNAEVARQRLERLEMAPRLEEIPPAEARVREAESALADALIQQRLIEQVTDKRAIRVEDLERRRQAVKSAEARLADVKSQLELLKAGTWKPDLKVARAEVEQAEAQVKRVEADLARLTMCAPIDGQILKVNVRPGEYAQAGQLANPLIIMGDVSALHVRADVDEHDAYRVKASAAAEASERGNSVRKAKLQFVRFEPYVLPKRSLTGDPTERVDTRVMQVIYRLPANADFRVGQQMDIFIEAAQ